MKEKFPTLKQLHLFLVALSFYCSFSCNHKIKYPEGGYSYSSLISADDSNYYFVPVRNLIPGKDSFLYVEGHILYNSFDEPNLSLKSNKEDIFRLTYECGLTEPIIIVITPTKIIIKEGKSGNPYRIEDRNQLSAIENLQYKILLKYFPFNDSNISQIRKHYIDSIVSLYPQILDSKYYGYLRNKAMVKNKNNFIYTTKIIPITSSIFYSLISQINSSGYWKMPYVINCESYPNDGCGFSLEASTRNKYNIVTVPICESDTTKFAEACQKLINYVHMNKSMHLLLTDEIDSIQ